LLSVNTSTKVKNPYFSLIIHDFRLGIFVAFNLGMNEFHAIASRIRSVRKSRGMTQEQLAEKVGLSTTYVGQIERSERVPTLNSLFGILKALKIEAAAMFAGLDDYSVERTVDLQVSYIKNKESFLKEIDALLDKYFQ